MRLQLPLILAVATITAFCSGAHAQTAPDTTRGKAVAALRAAAKALAPVARSALTRRFLDTVDELPPVAARTVYHDSTRTRYWTAAERAALKDTTIRARVLDERFYYNTRYGSPLAYLRPLEILAAAGFTDVTAKRIADYGYGTIGHLKVLAGMGADLTGIDVDPLLRALYSTPADTGVVRGRRGRAGRVAIVTGSFPGDAATAAAVGDSFDLFISKNTLKNGYIHPAEPVNPRMLVHLGVNDSDFVSKLYRMLKPGGRVLIYNLSPAPNQPGTPYKPWADGRCPFPEEMWRKAGFNVIAFDQEDSPAAREMGHALGWDQGENAMNLESDLFAQYTLVQKSGP
jgi:SAM-dependent methyltransferase